MLPCCPFNGTVSLGPRIGALAISVPWRRVMGIVQRLLYRGNTPASADSSSAASTTGCTTGLSAGAESAPTRGATVDEMATIRYC